MIDDGPPPVMHTITRTLTITTVETWSITIGPGDAIEDAVIDRVVEDRQSFNREEEA